MSDRITPKEVADAYNQLDESYQRFFRAMDVIQPMLLSLHNAYTELIELRDARNSLRESYRLQNQLPELTRKHFDNAIAKKDS